MSVEKINKTKNGMQGWKLRPYIADITGVKKQTSRIFYGTKKEAEAEHKRLEQTTSPENLTFMEAFNHFRKHKKVSVAYLEDIRNSIKRVSKVEPVISKLSRQKFNAWIVSLSKERSARTTNKISQQAITILKFCLETGLLIKEPEFFHHIRIPVPHKDPELLKINNLEEWLNPLDEDARLIVEFILYSSCRISAACNLKWEDVYENKVILTEKFSQKRTVILNKFLKPVIEKAKERRHPSNEYVFQKINKVTKNPLLRIGKWSKYNLNYHIKTRWKNLLGETKGVGLHRIRHTLATLAYSKGASLREVSAMLGHTHPDSIRSYIHLKDPIIAAEALENVWENIPLKK
jgi:integrase